MKAIFALIRTWLLARLLRPDQMAVVAALDKPFRWMPDPALTQKECDAWANALASPLMLKIDQAMINWVQQEAQRALQSPAPELSRQAGIALGCRAGWEMAKTLSRLPSAKEGLTEGDGSTAPASLEHAQP